MSDGPTDTAKMYPDFKSADDILGLPAAKDAGDPYQTVMRAWEEWQAGAARAAGGSPTLTTGSGTRTTKDSGAREEFPHAGSMLHITRARIRRRIGSPPRR